MLMIRMFEPGPCPSRPPSLLFSLAPAPAQLPDLLAGWMLGSSVDFCFLEPLACLLDQAHLACMLPCRAAARGSWHSSPPCACCYIDHSPAVQGPITKLDTAPKIRRLYPVPWCLLVLLSLFPPLVSAFSILRPAPHLASAIRPHVPSRTHPPSTPLSCTSS